MVVIQLIQFNLELKLEHLHGASKQFIEITKYAREGKLTPFNNFQSPTAKSNH